MKIVLKIQGNVAVGIAIANDSVGAVYADAACVVAVGADAKNTDAACVIDMCVVLRDNF